MFLQKGSIVVVKYVEHSQYNYLTGAVGVVEEIFSKEWCGANNITVVFPQHFPLIGYRMGWNRKQLQQKG
jgi:hypothetical protein